MTMSFVSSPASASLPLHIRRHLVPGTSHSFHFNPHCSPPRCRVPLKPLRFSRVLASSSCNSPTASVLPSFASASRTLLFLLATGLLSLSGVRTHPALASTPPPTQQSQQIERRQQQQQDEVEVKKEEERAQQEEDDDDDEVKLYSAILSRDPGDVDALKCALFAKMRRTDWGGALRYARRLRAAEPGEVEWRLMEAQLHELKGDLAEAERRFREVLADKPLLVRALHGLALCMHKIHEGPVVFEMLENALQLAISERRVPEERNIKLLIAQMHVVMGQLDFASEKLQNLINEDPRDFRPHLCQGIVYALLDKKEEADEQ